MNVRFAMALALICLTSTALKAKPLEDFAYNTVARPLTLGQEIFERSMTTSLVYYKYDSEWGDSDTQLGNVASTLWLAAGLTDWLQLGVSGTMSWSEPDVEFVRPTIEIAGLPIEYLAPRLRFILPDMLDDEPFGWAIGARGKYRFIPNVVAGVIDVDFEQYESTAEDGWDDYSKKMKTFQLIGMVQYAFAARFYVGAFGGVSKSWISAEDYETDDPDTVFRYGIELGFTSMKHMDIILRWGVPHNVDIGGAMDSIHVASITFGGRL